VSGEAVGDTACVRRALFVDEPPEQVQPRPAAADVPGQQQQVEQRVRGTGVTAAALDAGADDCRGPSCGDGVDGPPESVGVDPRDRRGAVPVEVHQPVAERPEAGRPLRDERFVDSVRRERARAQEVEHERVGPRPGSQVEVGGCRRLVADRVDVDECRPLVDRGANEGVERDRLSPGRVRADDEDRIGVADVGETVRRRRPPRPLGEGPRGLLVTQPRPVVDVVRPQQACELPQQVVLLVRAVWRPQERERVRPRLLADGREPVDGTLVCGLPVDRDEVAVAANLRLREPVVDCLERADPARAEPPVRVRWAGPCCGPRGVRPRRQVTAHGTLGTDRLVRPGGVVIVVPIVGPPVRHRRWPPRPRPLSRATR
jgi:hypothetical protein